MKVEIAGNNNSAMTKTNTSRRGFFTNHPELLMCLLLVTAILIPYWQVIHYDFLNYDDTFYITENSHVKSGFTIGNITWAFTSTDVMNWHPLTWLSHMLDYQIYGMKAGGHHLTNLLFHIANTLLLFLVFRKMTGCIWKSGFIAALFALHPLHVESVAWVSERKDVLSAFFWMLTMWSYLWYVQHQTVTRYLLVALFLTLGLMSKPMLVTLPFVLLLLDFYPLCRFRFQHSADSNSCQQESTVLELVREKVPLFILVAVSSFVTFYAQKHGGAVRSLDSVPIGTRIANSLVSYVSYIGKMIYPSNLAVIYPYPETLRWWIILGACFFLASISFIAISVIKQSPYFAFGWLWYVGTLVPVIGLVQVGSQSMADRYTYIPLIGLFLIVACGVPQFMGQWRQGRTGISILASVLILILMAVTGKQVGYWENNISLFEHTLEVTTRNAVANNNLGYALYKQGHVDEAIDHYFEALQIEPNCVEAHYNLADALRNQGRTAEAIDHYVETLRLMPDHVAASVNLGNALNSQGRTGEAIEHHSRALQISPDCVEAHYNLANSLRKSGRGEEAIEHYLEAVRLNPDHVQARNNLGIALALNGDIGGAIAQFREVLRIQPGHRSAKDNLKRALMEEQKSR